MNHYECGTRSIYWAACHARSLAQLVYSAFGVVKEISIPAAWAACLKEFIGFGDDGYRFSQTESSTR